MFSLHVSEQVIKNKGFALALNLHLMVLASIFFPPLLEKFRITSSKLTNIPFKFYFIDKIHKILNPCCFNRKKLVHYATSTTTSESSSK
jgi:hypothetical protein